jgi:ubiquitin C-terminal hydrolase
MVKEETLDGYKCDKCKNEGSVKQTLIGSFPKAMIFHMVSGNDSSIDYSSILVLNKKEYALLSVTCFDGSHWWGYGRDMPPGTAWFILNDTHVRDHGPKQFPVSPKMRLLIYYRLDE